MFGNTRIVLALLARIFDFRSPVMGQVQREYLELELTLVFMFCLAFSSANSSSPRVLFLYPQILFYLRQSFPLFKPIYAFIRSQSHLRSEEKPLAHKF